MNNTVLLIGRNKPLLILAGIIFIFNGCFTIYGDSHWSVSTILGGLMIISGLLYVIHGLFGFKGLSKYAPRITVKDKSIDLKLSVWKGTTSVNWEDINAIHFGSYRLTFDMTDGTKEFVYRSEADESRRLKVLIREAAERRNVEITGG